MNAFVCSEDAHVTDRSVEPRLVVHRIACKKIASAYFH
jgi:hypothetical protein